MSDSVRPHRRQPTRVPHPWDSPGKNTGVGCHFLLQCMKVKSESEVAQSCVTLSDFVDCSPPGSSVHGVFQARVLEWGAIVFWVTKSRTQLSDWIATSEQDPFAYPLRTWVIPLSYLVLEVHLPLWAQLQSPMHLFHRYHPAIVESCDCIVLELFLSLPSPPPPTITVNEIGRHRSLESNKSNSPRWNKGLWFSSKEFVYNAGDEGSIPGLGRSSGEGNGNPFQYSCLGNPMDIGAWWPTFHEVAKSRMTEHACIPQSYLLPSLKNSHLSPWAKPAKVSKTI